MNRDVFKKENKLKGFSLLVWIPAIIVILTLGIFLYLNFFPRVNPALSVEHNNEGMSIGEKIANGQSESIEKDTALMISEFKKAVKLDPRNISARKNLIYTYLFIDDYKNALKETENLLKIDPKNSFAIEVKKLLTEEEK
jgi:tetratricopeptide (TPR) repeat protein